MLDDFEDAFSQMTRARADALIVQAGPIFRRQRARIANWRKNRLPSVRAAEHVCGGRWADVVRYELTRVVRRAAMYVDKILKGTKPAIYR